MCPLWFVIPIHVIIQAMILTAKTLINGDGKTVLKDGALCFEGGRIVEAGPMEHIREKYPNHEVTKYGEATILPGLIDMHVHLAYWLLRSDRDMYDDYLVAYQALNNAQRALFAGVTTVRDVFGPVGACRQLNLAAKKGFVRAPRVIFCNRALCITGGIDWKSGGGTVQVDGEAEIVKAIRTEIREGAEWIKMMTSWRTPGVAEFSQAEMNAAVGECHRLGKKIAAHSTIPPSLEMCIEAGFDTIEHGTDLTLEQAKRMRDKGIAWVPTIFVHKITYENLVKRIEAEGYDSLSDRDKQTHELYGRCVKTYTDNFLRLADTGVTVLAGTDIVFEGGDAAPVADELACMTALGFDTLRAVAAATSSPAKVLGMEGEIGSLVPGAKADVLVVRGDVSKDIRALKDVEAVYLDGECVRREI